VCIYSNNDWIGEIGDRASGGAVVNITSTYNDEMDSYWNETSSNARWYYNPNGGGACNNLPAAHKDNNINVLSSDELSSWATNGAC
jgi:hypothetical protein